MTLMALLLSGGSVIDLDATLFVQLIIFFIALLILNLLVFQPLIRLFEAREAGIEGAKDQAKALQRDASEKAEAYDAQLNEVKRKAGKERDRLRSEGQRLERTILDKVRQETERSMEQAEVTLSKEAAQVRNALQKDVPAIASQIARKILHREIA